METLGEEMKSESAQIKLFEAISEGESIYESY